MVLDQQKIKKNLLKIYSENNFANVDDKLIVSVFFDGEPLTEENIKKRKEDLANNNIYLKTKEIISECRYTIDLGALNGQNADENTMASSVLFNVVLNRAIYYSSKLGKDEIRYNHQMSLLNELVGAIFIDTRQWSPRIVDHYNFVFPFLKDWYSYFLSYTNKSAYTLNKRFEAMLNFSASNDKNQVARFIADTLCKTENIPNGFIDEKELQPGELFPQRISDALKKSFSFVQVVSKEIFTLQGENWCKREYDEYKKNQNEFIKNINASYHNAFNNNIIYLVMASKFDDIKPKPPFDFPEYHDWVQDMEVREQMTGLEKDYNAFMDGITKLAKRIIALKYNLINTIPN